MPSVVESPKGPQPPLTVPVVSDSRTMVTTTVLGLRADEEGVAAQHHADQHEQPLTTPGDPPLASRWGDERILDAAL
jgi:hypothetical protein